jgi:hypothetical protein
VVLGIGLSPLSDNSFLTHLATGRLILDLGHVPTTDPYTFTAHGHGWVVQSWLASVLDGGADQLAGGDGVRVVVALLMAALFAVVWRLSRPARGLVVRVGICGLVVAVGSLQWSERPLVVGLLVLGLTVLAGEGELDPRWLLPLGWIWVNSHGSFPLGVAYLLVVALGRRLDHLDASVELRALRWLVGGILLGAVNPLGPRLLLFPIDLVQQQSILRHVVEWQAPTFTSLGQRIFLLQIALALLALVRRPRYRSGMVVAVFVVAALLGARNIAVASLVLVPVMAEAWPSVGTLRAEVRSAGSRVLALVAVVGIVVVALARLSEPSYDLSAYPVRSLDRLLDGHVDLRRVRMAAPERVGNLLELRDGPRREVFFDDRFDMFPEAVTDDVLALRDGRPTARGILDRYDIDLVLWRSQDPLVAILEASEDWRTVEERDPHWALLCRRGTELSTALGTC